MTGTARPEASRTEIRAEINVTPLVDVCLVLLIIFMVVTPLIRQGVDVDLPRTKAPANLDSGAMMLTLSIRADRSVWLDGERLAPGLLAAELRRRLASSSDLKLLVRGDRALRYGDVMEVLDVVNRAGITGAALATVCADGS